jgi:acyl-coenzyme A thioesterase PaaI-like protein
MTVTVSPTSRHVFSEVSALKPAGSGRFDADVDPEWTIGAKPNGGYLLAILGRAATWNSIHPHVIAASAHYLSSPDPGPVVIETEILRTGRSASQGRARMTQGEVACVEALITTSCLKRFV